MLTLFHLLLIITKTSKQMCPYNRPVSNPNLKEQINLIRPKEGFTVACHIYNYFHLLLDTVLDHGKVSLPDGLADSVLGCEFHRGGSYV